MARVRGKDMHKGYCFLVSREEHPSPYWGISCPNPSIPSITLLDGLLLAQLYTYILAKLIQNGAKFIQKLTADFKNHMRNSDNFKQAVESPKS